MDVQDEDEKEISLPGRSTGAFKNAVSLLKLKQNLTELWFKLRFI